MRKSARFMFARPVAVSVDGQGLVAHVRKELRPPVRAWVVGAAEDHDEHGVIHHRLSPDVEQCARPHQDIKSGPDLERLKNHDVLIMDMIPEYEPMGRDMRLVLGAASQQ